MMRRLLMIAGLALLQACQGTAPAPPPPYTDVDSPAFQQLMHEAGTVLLDVRTPPEIAAGKIEGALEIDYKAADFADRIATLDTTKTYLVYCRSGRRSAAACELMKQRGFDVLYNLEGGYLDWPPKQME